MKRISILLLGIVLFFSQFAKADEGMWFLAFLEKNYDEMKAMGFKLTPEDIYSVNNASLKDAIIVLDGGSCTGEIVSEKGLFFTNHHCGYGEIQAHSTVEHDYLEDGFWASSYEEELPNPGKTVSFLIRMEDVSSQILSKVDEKMSEQMRKSYIDKAIEDIEQKAIEGTNYTAEVQPMYEGNAYYLFIYETFKDVRLVGAPPSSIGKFGGDTDNWMWPRHTGDFSIFRIYCAPDGSPAEYSPDNVPLETETYLKINISDIEKGDFAMIMGYPGTTDRYLTSWEIEEVMNQDNKIRYKVRTKKLDILKKYMDKDPEIKIQYAAKYAQSANYWKYSEGQNLGLKRLKVVKRRKKLQKKLWRWIKKDKQRKEKYKDMFDIIENAVENHKTENIAMNYWFEAIYLGAEIQQFVVENLRFYQTLQSGSQQEIDTLSKEMNEKAQKFFKDYNKELDKEIFVSLVNMYFENIDKKYYPSIYDVIQSDYNGSIQKYADSIYDNSIFVDKEKYMQFLENPTTDKISKDIGFSYGFSMIRSYWNIADKKNKIDKKYTKGRRLFLDAYMKMLNDLHPDKLYYPDANSTLRLTYGDVGGYTYEDKKYDYYTTIDQYMKKEDPYNPEFYVKDRMKELYKKKDWGRYADSDGTLHINFLTDNDITGGNSGSPVLNGKGELIGIAFDGNWEGMSGDIAFEPDYQKTICVDINYVLWVIDKYANAQNLMDELTIIE